MNFSCTTVEVFSFHLRRFYSLQQINERGQEYRFFCITDLLRRSQAAQNNRPARSVKGSSWRVLCPAYQAMEFRNNLQKALRNELSCFEITVSCFWHRFQICTIYSP